MDRLRRISFCFWLAMTLAACSISRRCCSCASVMACSSCTLGSADSLNFPVSFAVVYAHHLLQPLAQCLELTDHVLDVRRERLEGFDIGVLHRQLDGLGHRFVELGVEQ